MKVGPAPVGIDEFGCGEACQIPHEVLRIENVFIQISSDDRKGAKKRPYRPALY